jgi:hypothetical protein
MGTSIERATISDRTSKFQQESLGYFESKHHNPWFDKECSKSAVSSKQAKLQWLQDPSELNNDNLSDIRWEDSRHFRNKKTEHLKDKFNKLESNSENKNIRELYRGINEFKKGYQPRPNLVKNDRSNLHVNPHKILNRWKKYFCQLLNVDGVDGVIPTKMHIAEPSVQKTSASEVKLLWGSRKDIDH